MGNRGGRIHDPATRAIIRRQASRRWIYCVLSFKGRRRRVMGEGYTELFFLDEASALAAGHRPCFECQRERAKEFARLLGMTRADEIDAALGRQRSAERVKVDARALPDGAMIAIDGEAYLICEEAARRWNGAGYREPKAIPAEALLLTPPLTLAAIRAGFAPAIAA